MEQTKNEMKTEFLVSHPRTQVDVKENSAKIASPWKFFAVQGGNGIKMVLAVQHFTACFIEFG